MAITGYGPPYGTGTPTTAPIVGGSLLRDVTTGNSFGSRRIDPITRDYVFDSNGRNVGMSDAQQLVLLAVTTDKGSSAVRELGHELALIDRISANFRRKVRDTLEQAVDHLVVGGIIEVVDVVVAVSPQSVGRASIRLVWRDLNAGAQAPNQITEVP